MEDLIPQTLREIDRRIPDALRLTFGIPNRTSPSPLPGQHDEVAAFATALLPPRVGDQIECEYNARTRWGQLTMVSQSCYLPRHGEDAHFIHAAVVGVADGVGGYRSEGVDASAFARALMHNAYMEVVSTAPGTHICPRGLLERAYRKAVTSRTPAASTAVILSLAGRTLRWAYVGDSGFAVFRDGRLFLRSQAQQQHFNCPYQLSSMDTCSRISDAAVGEVAAMEGDFAVVGTDGLFDNVSDDELERIVRMGAAMGFSPKNMADIVAGFVYEVSRCSYRDTPERQGDSFHRWKGR